jgi:pimeloyl-ACP methyl ester carboxylesterase
MARRTLAFLGGNGHCAARLDAARSLLPAEVELVEAPYPGFEGRPRAAGLDAFLDAIEEPLLAARADLVCATGAGGLLSLCLRARGALLDTPILLQGPVLWGLEKRWMPRVMRLRPVQRAVSQMFATAMFRQRFVRRYFTHPPDAATIAAFFEGYARCPALPDLFAWLTPSLLRSLERDLGSRPERLARIRVWWGGKDAVVSPRELAWTAERLPAAARWPVRIFPDWGHYPMIDAPAEWAEAVSHAMAAA